MVRWISQCVMRGQEKFDMVNAWAQLLSLTVTDNDDLCKLVLAVIHLKADLSQIRASVLQ
jgi:hypothetical protein